MKESVKMEVTETRSVEVKKEINNPEQAEMNKFAETQMKPEQKAEMAEMQAGEQKLGYSSDYYKHRMETALRDGNKIALEHARNNYAKAKVNESLK